MQSIILNLIELFIIDNMAWTFFFLIEYTQIVGITTFN